MRLKTRLLAVVGLAGLAISWLSVPLSAGAFGAYGAGTSGNPYRIASCVQLHEIDNDLAAYYILVANIDCSGSTFTHMGTFTGTLDGQNHTIAHLTIDNWALFQSSSGATIKNISIASGSISGGYVASFVWDATDTTFTNIHSAMTITNSAGYTGGLVGQLKGTASVSQSSYAGTISGTGYAGGLVGASWDAGTSITDSFSTGTLNVGSVYMGGIIGGYFNGSISRVYSAMTINVNNKNYVGGLVGDDQEDVNDSFSAATMVGGNSNDGGIVGLDNAGTYSNIFYDKTTNNTTKCFGVNGSGTCTGVNTGNATPSYFKNNSTNAPLDSWNFTSIWQTTASYPTLRNIAGFDDAAAPNSGDANGDGTADSYQAHVASVAGSSGAWATVSVPSSTGCTIGSSQSLSPSSDTGFSHPVDLNAFNVYCPSSGLTVPVTIIYDKAYDTSHAALRFYNSSTHTYSTLPGASFGTITIGGVTKTTVTYSLTDGGAYDGDGVANGLIIDPVGLATAITAPDTGFVPHGNQAAWIILAMAIVAMTGAGLLQRNAR